MINDHQRPIIRSVSQDLAHDFLREHHRTFQVDGLEFFAGTDIHQPDRRVLTRSANGCLRHELIGVASKLRSRSGHKRSILVPESPKVQNGFL
jgi:hypothetical protein